MDFKTFALGTMMTGAAILGFNSCKNSSNGAHGPINEAAVLKVGELPRDTIYLDKPIAAIKISKFPLEAVDSLIKEGAPKELSMMQAKAYMDECLPRHFKCLKITPDSMTVINTYNSNKGTIAIKDILANRVALNNSIDSICNVASNKLLNAIKFVK